MKYIFILASSLLMLSCGDDAHTPVTPTPIPRVTAPTFAVSGTIRDDADRPLAGVQVTAGQLFSKTGPAFQTATDNMGRYAGRLPTGSHMFWLTKPGFRPLRREGVVVSGDTTIDATLQQGVIVSGAIREPGADLVDGVTIEIISGSNAGHKTVSGSGPFRGAYRFDYLLPGEMRLRASKQGYDTVEQAITATIDTTADFNLRMTYGSCLRSVGPLFFDQYRAIGGAETIDVQANADRSWTATSEVTWLEIPTPPTRSGSDRIAVRVQPHPIGAIDSRRGVLTIRCSASEAQAVTFVQKPDCQVRLAAGPTTPPVFPSEGGIGGLNLEVGVAQCLWKAESRADWMHTVGVSSWRGLPPISEVKFVVQPNPTGAPRTGQILVGETVWTVDQR
jgi:hypothetical protein